MHVMDDRKRLPVMRSLRQTMRLSSEARKAVAWSGRADAIVLLSSGEQKRVAPEQASRICHSALVRQMTTASDREPALPISRQTNAEAAFSDADCGAEAAGTAVARAMSKANIGKFLPHFGGGA